MPWTMEDYPQSWKNFEELERKKRLILVMRCSKMAIKESDVIPIATNQAEKHMLQKKN